MNTKDVSFDQEKISEEEFKTVFCDYWVIISAGLLKLKDTVKNPIYRFFIGVAIDIGQAAFDKNCGATVPTE